MKVVFNDQAYQEGQKHEILGQQCESVSLSKLVKEADMISLHLPKTDKTNKMVNKEFLAQLKPTCILINTSRGDLVNEDDLLAHLEANKHFRFGTDVFMKEPSEKKGPFVNKIAQHPRVSATCHIGASTVQAEEAVGDGLVDILTHYKKKGQFINVVNELKPKL